MSKLRFVFIAFVLALAMGAVVSVASPGAWADSHTNMCVDNDGNPC